MSCCAGVRVIASRSHVKRLPRQNVVTRGFWLRPTPVNPAYNKYRTPEQVKESSAERYWRIANPERETGATIWSCITWIPGFLKFYVVPYPFKFLFFLLWAPLREVLFHIHKGIVLQCCKVDAMIAGKPKDIYQTTSGAQARFDRGVFLERLHGQRNILQDLWYWARLASHRG